MTGKCSCRVAVLSLSLLACTGEISSNNPQVGAGAPPGGGAGTGSMAGSGGASGGVVGTASCDDDGVGVAIPKRLVRLSYAQLANGVSSLLGEAARTAVSGTGVVPG